MRETQYFAMFTLLLKEVNDVRRKHLMLVNLHCALTNLRRSIIYYEEYQWF